MRRSLLGAVPPENRTSLVRMLRIGRSFDEIQAAQRNGIQIVDERVIYFVLRHSNPEWIRHHPSRTSPEVAAREASCWRDLHGSRAALAAGPAENPTDAQLAATYAMLKRLDDLTANGVDIGQAGNPLRLTHTGYWMA